MDIKLALHTVKVTGGRHGIHSARISHARASPKISIYLAVYSERSAA